MRLIDSWLGGASAYRQFAYRIVEIDGRPVLQVKGSLEDDAAYRPVAEGHAVAQRVAHLILEEKKTLQLRRVSA